MPPGTRVFFAGVLLLEQTHGSRPAAAGTHSEWLDGGIRLRASSPAPRAPRPWMAHPVLVNPFPSSGSRVPSQQLATWYAGTQVTAVAAIA